MSTITYYNPNSELCLEVRQWILDNPQNNSDVKSIGESSWNKGMVGPNSHSYGVPKSKETRKKMSDYSKTRTYSKETRKKISENRKGIEPWNKGKKGVQVAWNKGITSTHLNKSLPPPV